MFYSYSLDGFKNDFNEQQIAIAEWNILSSISINHMWLICLAGQSWWISPVWGPFRRCLNTSVLETSMTDFILV